MRVLNQVIKTLTLLGVVSVTIQAPPEAFALHLASDKTGGTEAVVLQGTVRGPSGKALEGVAISAKAKGETITTTVYTDQAGQYVYPPLHAGDYRVWAQAVGFNASQLTADLNHSGTVQLNFALKTIEDFTSQLSAQEFIAALPEDTTANRRMKVIFRNTCTGCHPASFTLQNRFNEEGWKRIINYMQTTSAYAGRPGPEKKYYNLMVPRYKDQLAAYLARVRGPGPSPMNLKPFPRPTGEAARIVVTEYDIPNGETGRTITHNGSLWAEGTPSAYESRGPHDAVVDANGIVWMADTDYERTVSRLDPKTGKVKDYQLKDSKGNVMRSHGSAIDREGVLWFNAGGGLGKLDPKTEKLAWFKTPEGMARVGGTIDVDPKGFVWASARVGALRFDPSTNKFSEFRSLDDRAGTYGVAADAEGNGWWAQLVIDTLGKSDIRTGKSEQVVLDPLPVNLPITDDDRKIFAEAGASNNTAPPGSQGPRRLSGDPKGDSVWVGDFHGDNLARINIRTKKVDYYPLPHSGPYQEFGIYDTVVDKNGTVWANLQNCDCFAKFDPKSEMWTVFPLPTRGTESRFIDVDNYKDSVEVWIPYWRTNKIARIQFR